MIRVDKIIMNWTGNTGFEFCGNLHLHLRISCLLVLEYIKYGICEVVLFYCYLVFLSYPLSEV